VAIVGASGEEVGQLREHLLRLLEDVGVVVAAELVVSP
jgi:hypothetical protein